MTKWEKNRIAYMKWLENVIEEFSLCDTVNSLKWMEEETIIFFQVSARKYRLEMKAILDDE